MSIDAREVRRIARLAELELDEAELEPLREQLGAILDHVARLDEVDVGAVDPTTSTVAGEAPRRTDDPRPSLEPERALENAPEHGAGHFRVPQVLGSGEA